MIDTAKKEIHSHYDYIVVGAGAAGSVLGAELSASGAEVLIIESGGPDDAPTIMNPSIWFYNVAGPLDYHLPVSPSPRLNNRKFNMALGHVLGGGTSINAMVWMRGITTGGPRTELKVGPSPTCFRCSRVRRIGKVARMNGAEPAAPSTSVGQRILIPQHQPSLKLHDRWECPFSMT
jgi:choline dehydrogenase-like flavoprotein